MTRPSGAVTGLAGGRPATGTIGTVGDETQSTTRTDDALGPNAWLVDEMYEQYLADPGSVSESWRDFFADYRRDADHMAPPTPGSAPATAPAGNGALDATNGSTTAGARNLAPTPAAPAAPTPAPATKDAKAVAGHRRGRAAPRRGGPHRPEHGGEPRRSHRHELP